MLTLSSQLNATRLWLALGLTLASFMIAERTEFITRFGFPTPVATWYNYPQTFSEEHWFTFVTRLAINPLQGLVNLIFFYLAVSVVNWLWQKVISRRSG